MTDTEEAMPSRWWAEVVARGAEAFALAIERGELELAERWADVLLRHLDRKTEDV